MTPTVDTVLFCPKCHSPAVEYGTLIIAETPASCKACGWKGERGDLLVVPYAHNQGAQEEVLIRFVNDYRTVFAKDCAVVIGRWLTRWGFLPQDPKEMSKVLAKYIQNIAKASISAILQTRQDFEKEKVHVQ